MGNLPPQLFVTFSSVDQQSGLHSCKTGSQALLEMEVWVIQGRLPSWVAARATGTQRERKDGANSEAALVGQMPVQTTGGCSPAALCQAPAPLSGLHPKRAFLGNRGQGNMPSKTSAEILAVASVILELKRWRERDRETPSPTPLSRKGGKKPEEEEGPPRGTPGH